MTSDTKTSTELSTYSNDNSLVLRLTGAFRASIYNMFVSRITTRWYETILEQVPDGSVVLDVGCGPAGALLHCRPLLLKKQIRVVGIDSDPGYVAAARSAVLSSMLENTVRVYHCNVYNLDTFRQHIVLPGSKAAPPTDPKSDADKQKKEEKLFDVVIFSGTMSLLQNPIQALKLVKALQKQKGKIFIANAYQRRTPPMARFFKSMLKYVTTVDHGQLITLAEAEELYQRTVRKECALAVKDHFAISNSIDNLFEVAYLTRLEPPF